MAIEQMSRALKAMFETYPDMTVSQAITLLEIAQQPGLTGSDLREQFDASKACLSARIGRLGSHPSREGGLGLVKTTGDKKDIRFKRISLTPAGEKLLNDVRWQLRRTK